MFLCLSERFPLSENLNPSKRKCRRWVRTSRDKFAMEFEWIRRLREAEGNPGQRPGLNIFEVGGSAGNDESKPGVIYPELKRIQKC